MNVSPPQNTAERCGIVPQSPWQRYLDVAAAAGGVLVLSPLLALIALMIRVCDGGPVLYCARRVGQGGNLFRLRKFRTMVIDADRQGPGITRSGDARVTPLGRWLRRTKLDELPQLLNVLTGDMALVGPRPEDPRYVALYTPEQRRVLLVRPGLTSAASLQYSQEERLLQGENWEHTYCTLILPRKLASDLRYLARRSAWSDCRLVIRTVATLLVRTIRRNQIHATSSKRSG